MLRVMDLFSGIGGFSLGLKKAGGFRTVAYCEIDPYCQQVLRARMLDGSLDTAPICSDVRKLDGKPWAGRVELLCGGFPCQDISIAGAGAGLDGERSGLWSEIRRLVCEVRPRYVIVENVSALLARGLGRVLGELAESGYDAEWDCIPASAVGAPHRRDRVWIVAYPQRAERRPLCAEGVGVAREYAVSQREEGSGRPRVGRPVLDNALRGRHGTQEAEVRPGWDGVEHSGWWAAEPSVGRMADGIPDRVDRLSGLGNAVVPQVVEWIGRRIMNVDSADL